jgi:hypothetical protein
MKILIDGCAFGKPERRVFRKIAARAFTPPAESAETVEAFTLRAARTRRSFASRAPASGIVGGCLSVRMRSAATAGG